MKKLLITLGLACLTSSAFATVGDMPTSRPLSTFNSMPTSNANIGNVPDFKKIKEICTKAIDDCGDKDASMQCQRSTLKANNWFDNLQSLSPDIQAEIMISVLKKYIDIEVFYELIPIIPKLIPPLIGQYRFLKVSCARGDQTACQIINDIDKVNKDPSAAFNKLSIWVAKEQAHTTEKNYLKAYAKKCNVSEFALPLTCSKVFPENKFEFTYATITQRSDGQYTLSCSNDYPETKAINYKIEPTDTNLWQNIQTNPNEHPEYQCQINTENPCLFNVYFRLLK